MAKKNELGAVEILEKGLGASFDYPTITVRCGFGRLIIGYKYDGDRIEVVHL